MAATLNLVQWLCRMVLFAIILHHTHCTVLLTVSKYALIQPQVGLTVLVSYRTGVFVY